MAFEQRSEGSERVYHMATEESIFQTEDSKSQVRETEASLVWSSEPSKQSGEERDRSWGAGDADQVGPYR